jgi:hypothetical protein
MSQHDMAIDNGPGLAVRTDMNAAFQALASMNAGPIEPVVKYAGQIWLDTTVAPDGLMRQRNQANTAWIALQSGLPADAISSMVVTVITTSGTYTKPAGLKFLEVTLVGAGGGSGTAPVTGAGQASCSGGGSGGATAIKLYAAADISATEAYTIGAGGTTAAAGGAGGTSTFKGLTAGGGGGGSTNTGAGNTPVTSGSGPPGAATGGDLNVEGSWGGYGIRFPHGLANAIYGPGGASFLTTINAPINHVVNSTTGGKPGRFPGGGAAGAANGQSQSSVGGGSGGGGGLILKEYF